MQSLLGNGKPGTVKEIQEDLKELKDLLLKARYAILGMVVALGIMMFLSGSGTVSLKTVMEFLK